MNKQTTPRGKPVYRSEADYAAGMLTHSKVINGISTQRQREKIKSQIMVLMYLGTDERSAQEVADACDRTVQWAVGILRGLEEIGFAKHRVLRGKGSPFAWRAIPQNPIQ